MSTEVNGYDCGIELDEPVIMSEAVDERRARCLVEWNFHGVHVFFIGLRGRTSVILRGINSS
jgi:hypothetical protein